MEAEAFRDKAVVVRVVANDESKMRFEMMFFAEGFPIGEVVFTRGRLIVVWGVDEVDVFCKVIFCDVELDCFVKWVGDDTNFVFGVLFDFFECGCDVFFEDVVGFEMGVEDFIIFAWAVEFFT